MRKGAVSKSEGVDGCEDDGEGGMWDGETGEWVGRSKGGECERVLGETHSFAVKDGCGDEDSGARVHDSGCKVWEKVECVTGMLVGENTEPSPLSTHLTLGCMCWLCVVCMYRVYALVEEEQPALVEGEQGQMWWLESEDWQ